MSADEDHARQIAVLTAHRDIEQQIFRMGYHLEDGDFEAVADLLADSTFGADVLGAKSFRGRDEIRAQYERTNVTYPGIGRATKEVYSNVVIDIDIDAGTANSMTSYTVAQQPPSGAFELLVAGRYLDEWTRVGDGWTWSDRYIKVQYRNDLSRHMNDGTHPWSRSDPAP
ncbi:hypothetical protein BH10ACT3_BH10ACT3_14070 [soil metagenome]